MPQPFVPDAGQSSLESLGKRLREARLARNEPQEIFAQRLRVSVPTLRAMEQGRPTTQIGTWVAALWALRRLGELDGLLGARESLFDEAHGPRRRRAVRRRI